MLVDYSWPGNVRELRNFSERALLLSPMETISEGRARGAIPVRPPPPCIRTCPPPTRRRAARSSISSTRNSSPAVERNGGNVSATAREIGIERQYLHKILKRIETGQSGDEETETPSRPRRRRNGGYALSPNSRLI